MAVQGSNRPKTFFEQLDHITIAVIDENGLPWAVPVAVQKYDHGTIEWFSKTNTVHSKAIAKTPEVMLTAFMPKNSEHGEFGVFARARAKKVMALPGIGRYRAEMYQAWYTDTKHKKIEIAIKDL